MSINVTSFCCFIEDVLKCPYGWSDVWPPDALLNVVINHRLMATGLYLDGSKALDLILQNLNILDLLTGVIAVLSVLSWRKQQKISFELSLLKPENLCVSGSKTPKWNSKHFKCKWMNMLFIFSWNELKHYWGLAVKCSWICSVLKHRTTAL